jgi:hypothetical protein
MAEASRPSLVSVAILHSDPPRVYLAESEEALSLLLAMQVVAESNPAEISSPHNLDDIRQALLDEEWARAVQLWLLSTDEQLDVYGSEQILWEEELNEDLASMEIRLSPIFEDIEDRDDQ